ncbi:glycosyltransferase family 39 protein [Stereum hirsutum FP-91666 SS1]|uniref:glycosyltransferase family 39 protein n=1 Tax=Stereum hirsutum (strain FP-91666) TaxID=721885 RepID=UPI000440F0B2|nr:glycosyltransferase family 39 protein [Stereum hirsutum FP-91666 SS1]EIM89627.1 glycosyltransferase family 39 protein [Stereum hirsutum FP-91666 SS1]
MTEDTAARRRVPRGPSALAKDGAYDGQEKNWEYDDEGKDVYAKAGPAAARMSSGRPARRGPPPPPTTIREFFEQNLEHVPPIIYTLLSCWTRFHKIGHSGVVVWDEAHFGKFGSHYLKREFYFDVHPPLGKMIVGFVGLLAGYDGHFDFKSGGVYPAEVPYVAMRVMMAMFGVLMVPLGWYTAVELGMTRRACHLVALMVLCDVAWLCISRFILLDSMLLFFTFTTVFFLTKFHNQQYQPFSVDWWLWLGLTGLSIGCVSSIKLIGLFVTALVGLYTIEDLWEKFGDLRMTVRTQLWHWGARVGCLIVLPILVYMASFKLHFLVLNHSGPGDAQMSSLFQANLVGNDFASNPLDVAFGSRLTLKNMGWGGGLLHSHVQTYPVGSNQQQVTCYHYKDSNNDWVISPKWDEPPVDPQGEIRFLEDGDVIRLVHASTTRNLHSHNIVAPISKLNNEVSAYGNATIGDFHDYWVVEVVDDVKRGAKGHFEKIHSLTTRLRFRHEASGCYLRAANNPLPEWGFKQIEVSCDKENNPKDIHTYWNVESHWNERLPAGNAKFYRSPFLRDFWHLNVAMMTSNNALIPDPDKEDILASKPTDWPWLRLGLRMCGWGDSQTKYYLLGTPIIWWGGTLSLIVSVAATGIYVLRMQRRFVDMDAREWEHFLYVGKIALFGWILHYAPFLVMGRVTYVHHYLPTLYFSVLMLAHLIDHFVFSSRRLSERTKWIVFGVCTSSIVFSFWWFKGVAFGIDGPINNHWGLQWRESWNIYEHH